MRGPPMRTPPPGYRENAEKWAERFATLTPCQLQVARLLSVGLNATDIAHELHRTPAAIWARTRTIYRKLCCSTVAEVVIGAVAAGLVGVDAPRDRYQTQKERRAQQQKGKGGRGQSSGSLAQTTSAAQSQRFAADQGVRGHRL